ncbi:MAG: hypothetical protein ABI288_06290 [Ginsengibacter sp.]
MGKSSFGKCKSLLHKKEIYILTELFKRSDKVFLALIRPIWGGQKKFYYQRQQFIKKMAIISELVQEGAFKPVIGQLVNAR